jgi:hypothetical protein
LSVENTSIALNELGEVGGNPGGWIFAWSDKVGLKTYGKVDAIYAIYPTLWFNKQSEVTGFALSYQPYTYRAYLASQTDIQFIDAFYSYPAGLNDKSEMVGTMQEAGGRAQAFYWTERGGLVNIGAQIGAFTSSASMIDAQGLVFGTLSDTSSAQSYFLWERQRGLLGTMAIPTPCEFPSPAVLSPRSILLSCGLSPRQVWLWTPETGTREVGSLGFCEQPGRMVALSPREVLLTCGVSRGRVALWTAETGIRDIGSLGYNVTIRVANRSGVFAGFSSIGPSALSHPFVWSLKNGLIDLDPNGSNLGMYFTSINDDGLIGGSLNNHAAVWTPALR